MVGTHMLHKVHRHIFGSCIGCKGVNSNRLGTDYCCIPLLFPTVFATGQSVWTGQRWQCTIFRRPVPPFPELADKKEPSTRADDILLSPTVPFTILYHRPPHSIVLHCPLPYPNVPVIPWSLPPSFVVFWSFPLFSVVPCHPLLSSTVPGHPM